MAVKTLLDSSRLLNQIQQNKAKDGDVQILTKLDLQDFDNDSQFHIAPISLLHRQRGFNFNISVIRSDVDNLSLTLKMRQTNKDLVMEWSVSVKWKVSIINERTEQSFDFTPIYLTFNQQSLEKQANTLSDSLLINLNKIKDSIINNNILLKWSIEFVPSQQEALSSMKSSGKIQDIDQLKAQMESVIDLVQQNEKKLNSADSRRQMEEIKDDVSRCELDEDKLVTVENKLREAEERIDKLLEQYQTQADQVSAFMSEFNGALAHGNGIEITDIETSDLRTDSIMYNPDTSKESKDSSKSLHFLLVGEAKAGKSATGNSILFKKVFNTGLHTNVSHKPIVNKSQVRLSNLDACITVVESHDNNLEIISFDTCPEGFDAVIFILNYNQLYTNSSKNYFQEDFTDGTNEEIKNNFGILLITGGDSIELDHPNQDVHTIFGWNAAFCKLKNAVQDRVIVFDNTTTSKTKKCQQLKKLLEIVDNLPKRPARLNKDLHIKYMMSSLKSKISNLHILKHWGELNLILRRFIENKDFDCQLINVFRLIQNTVERVTFSPLNPYLERIHYVHTYGIKTYGIRVLVFGKRSESIEAFDRQTESMGIRVHYRHIHFQSYCGGTARYTGIILVIPFSKLSKNDEEIIMNYISVVAFREKSILVVTDVDSENVKERESEFFERCKDEPGVFKELYEFCSGRVVLFDGKTGDAIKRLEQEAKFVNILLDLKFDRQKETPPSSPPLMSPIYIGDGIEGFDFEPDYQTEKKREDTHLEEKLKKLEIDGSVEEKIVSHKTLLY